MFKKKLFTKSYKFCIKNCQKMSVFLPKCRLLRQESIIFYLFLFSETQKNLLKNIRRRFFKFTIFLPIIMLENLEILESYRKNQIIYFSIEITQFYI